jgi:UDP-N-acetylglucosamine 3-dehydrogenase
MTVGEKTEYRAAVIGCGPHTETRGGATAIAYAHGAAYACHPQTTMVAAASRTQANLDDFSNEFGGISTYTDYRAMLRSERPEIVSVCAFARDRVAMVRAALENGALIVWVEKPFALSLAEAEEMIEAAARGGVRLFVDFQRRFGEPFSVARRMIGEGQIGALQSIDLVQPGTNILNFGPHLVDMAVWFLGDAQPIRALAAVDRSGDEVHQQLPVEAALLGAVDFRTGERLTVSTGSEQPARCPAIRVNGSEGFIELRVSVEATGGAALTVRTRDSASLVRPEMIDNFHVGEDPNAFYDRALAEIISVTTEKRPCMLDAANSLASIELTNALLESGRLGRAVRLPLEQRRFPWDLEWNRQLDLGAPPRR